MNFAETIAFLSEQKGRYVEVQIQIPSGDAGLVDVAALAGQVSDVTGSGGRNGHEARRVWLQRGDTGDDLSFRIDAALFESAEVRADVVPADERPEAGTTWTLTIRQGHTITDVLIYV